MEWWPRRVYQTWLAIKHLAINGKADVNWLPPIWLLKLALNPVFRSIVPRRPFAGWSKRSSSADSHAIGFLSNLRDVPIVIHFTGSMLPATYFMEQIRTLFLVGNIWPLIFQNCAILAGYAVLLLTLAWFVVTTPSPFTISTGNSRSDQSTFFPGFDPPDPPSDRRGSRKIRGQLQPRGQ